jgi:quinol monooxygenase YgiN
MASAPRRQVLTEVRATVDPSRHEALVAGFEALLAESRPEGLLRTELLHVDGEWRIQTLWRDREALAAMRSSTAEPAAPKLFRSVGARPELTILEVRASTEA